MAFESPSFRHITKSDTMAHQKSNIHHYLDKTGMRRFHPVGFVQECGSGFMTLWASGDGESQIIEAKIVSWVSYDTAFTQQQLSQRGPKSASAEPKINTGKVPYTKDKLLSIVGHPTSHVHYNIFSKVKNPQLFKKKGLQETIVPIIILCTKLKIPWVQSSLK